MTLRTRVALAVSSCVAITIAAVAFGAYSIVSRQLKDDFDRRLTTRAAEVTQTPNFGLEALRAAFEAALGQSPGGPRPRIAAFGDFESSMQVVDPQGRVVFGAGPLAGRLPAPARSSNGFANATIEGIPIRVLSTPTFAGNSLQVAQSRADLDRTLDRLALLFLAGGALAAIATAASGWYIANRALKPIAQLTDTCETVSRTGEFTNRPTATVPAGRTDEIGRLAQSFDSLLSHLAQSRQAQRRLVDDASHELRTPLSALRTNVELLGRHRDLAPGDRDELVREIVTELDDLTSLVDEIVGVARDHSAPDRPAARIELDAVARSVAERMARRHGRTIEVVSDGSAVIGQADLLERAIANLVANACKYSESSPIEILVDRGAVRVRDRGPGLPPAEQLRVFDRFYRGPTAAGTTGSGLGLSIVRDVALAHGGSLWVSTTPEGGADIGFVLPVVADSHPALMLHSEPSHIERAG